jgi:hypothetical protein
MSGRQSRFTVFLARICKNPVTSITIILSVVAIIISIKSCIDARVARKLSNKPLLNVQVDENCGLYGLYVVNKGNGSAIINDCKVLYNGQKMNDHKELTDMICQKEYSNQPMPFVLLGTPLPIKPETAIAIGEKVLIIGLPGSDNSEARILIDSVITHMSIYIIYSSIEKDQDKTLFSGKR